MPLFKKIRKLAMATIITLSLTSCVTALVASAVVATVDIIHDRRTIGEYIDDNTIEITARNILGGKLEVRNAARVKVQSWNGVLLMTGEITDQETRQYLITKFTDIRGVRQVVDETIIESKTPLSARTKDVWIANKVKSRLVVKTGLDANRIKVIVTRATVYLMGIVTKEESEKATEIAKTTRGVVKVVKVFEYTDENSDLSDQNDS